jgi:hypothetical protein
LRFARIVFAVAGFWGLCVTMPLYFLYDFINGRGPAPITLPEFYFGFAGVTLAWQIAFLIIAADPARHRMMMIPSIIEKLSYVSRVTHFAPICRTHSRSFPSVDGQNPDVKCLVKSVSFSL